MRIYTYFALFCVSLILASCSDNEDNNISSPTEEVVPGTNHHVLIAYFSEPLPDGVDANTSASRVIVNGDLYGSVEYMATVIGEATGADMVRIQTATPYPGNFDDLASQADNERQNNIHPALATDIENFDDYDVIFVGYPIWWYQMPRLCIHSLTNTTLQVKQLFLSPHMEVVAGQEQWMTLLEWNLMPQW